jgi:hypothetical protein
MVTAFIAVVTACILWLTIIGVPVNLIRDLGPINSATVTLARSGPGFLKRVLVISDQTTLGEIDDALRSHWDPYSSNLTLFRYLLEVRDASGASRKFLFSNVDFQQFGRTPDIKGRG